MGLAIYRILLKILKILNNQSNKQFDFFICKLKMIFHEMFSLDLSK